MPLPPSVQALPPSPTTIRPAPACTAAAISCPTPLLCAASAVCTVGGPPKQRQPAGLRALDVGGPGRGRVEHPLRGHLFGQRAAHAKGVRLTEPACQHTDEAGSTVGLRGKRQFVVGAAAAPACRDRFGGLDRRQAVAVAVGRDQHLHHGRLIWQSVKLLGRKKDNPMPNRRRLKRTCRPARSAPAPPPPRASRPRNAARRRRKRGPVAPAPMTAAEARRRRKEIGAPKLSRDERKSERLVRRAEMSERREKMMAGEDAYLLPRDKGPVRRFVRDVVDSRRNVLGLFMPAALGLIFVMLAVPSLTVQRLLSPAMLVLVLIMVIDGFIVGRKVNRLVDEKFPEQHRKWLETRLLRRQPRLTAAPDARAPAAGQSRR